MWAILSHAIETTTRMLDSASTTQKEPSSLSSEDAFVTVHALSAGHFTLPEYQFVQPVSENARRKVPSLAFLLQHHDSRTDRQTRIVFDLGLRRDVSRYDPAIQKHLATRQPMSTYPDVVESLAQGGLNPNDIDFVFYSHASIRNLTQRTITESAPIRCTGITLASLEISPRRSSL